MSQPIQVDKLVDLLSKCCNMDIPRPENIDLYNWDVLTHVYEHSHETYLVSLYSVILKLVKESSVDLRYQATCIIVRSLQNAFLYLMPMSEDELKDSVSRLTVLVMHGCYRALLLLNPILNFMDLHIRNLLLSKHPKYLYDITIDIDRALQSAMRVFVRSQRLQQQQFPFCYLYPSLSLTFNSSKRCFLRKYCRL